MMFPFHVSGRSSRNGERAHVPVPRLLRAGGGVGALPSLSVVLAGGGVPVASSTLVGLLNVAGAAAGDSSALSGTATAVGCSAVCGVASSAAQTGSLVPWPAAWPELTSDAVLKEQNYNKKKSVKYVS